jgi:hypothetical protein
MALATLPRFIKPSTCLKHDRGGGVASTLEIVGYMVGRALMGFMYEGQCVRFVSKRQLPWPSDPARYEFRESAVLKRFQCSHERKVERALKLSNQPIRHPYFIEASGLCRRKIYMPRGLQSFNRCPRLYPNIEKGTPSPHREHVGCPGRVVNQDESATMDTCFRHILSVPRQ